MIKGNSNDNGFIARLTKIVEANLENEHFGVNELAEKSGLSRSQIHRRLKSGCNKSVSQFIREVRLENAKEFLEEGSMTISEIAYKVGFGSPSYFIKSFHDYFGFPPGEYVKYAPEETAKKENAVLTNEVIQEKAKKSFFKTPFVLDKKVLLVLIAVAIVVSVIFAINKFMNRELSVAVLPMDNFAGHVDSEHLAYGIQADLIAELSELKDLRVISQWSANAAKDKMVSLKDFAGRLNVDLVLTAGLIQVGDSLEIVLNLVDVFPNERNILTNKYEADMENIMQIFSLAVRDIAQKLHINITDDLKRKLSQPRKVNPESKKAYYTGKYILGKDDRELFDEGIKYIREAIDKDPSDPFAYAAVALGYAIKGHHSGTPNEDFSTAEFYANIALEMDPTIEEAFTARAMLNLYQRWEWDKAKNAFTEALQINPNDDVAHAHFAWYYEVHNDFDNAVYHAKKAVTLNPLYLAYNAWLAAIYYRAGEYEQAETYAKIVLAERDSSVYANIVLGWINLLRKNYPEAIKYTEKLPTKPIYWDLYRAYIYNKAGEKQKALTFRNNMEERALNRNVPDWYRGLMAAIFGYKDEAFKHFNTAIDKKQYQMMYINWYPFTENLRNDPRYNELLKRMNLPPNNENQMAAAR